jgi:glutamyl-tRNA synthetase
VSSHSITPTGRLAPSPTGFLHVGHARSFLLAWWDARARGGRIVLRIEDLDRERCRPEYVDAARADLEWLGLDWDGEELVQSRDLQPYQRACNELVAQGLAYPCVCSRAEIAALSAPHASDGEQRYPGTCRGKWSSVAAAREASGRAPGLRLAVPSGPVRIEDRLRGPLEFDVQSEVGDFLVQRRDGAFAYQLAVVVDDGRQGVDTVVRGEDLLSSAARQALLQERLGLARPTWAHVGLVVDARGERLAKRRGDLALAELRRAGVDPRDLAAWAARSVGLELGPRIAPGDVLPHFRLTAAAAAPARWDAGDPSARQPST